MHAIASFDGIDRHADRQTKHRLLELWYGFTFDDFAQITAVVFWGTQWVLLGELDKVSVPILAVLQGFN